MNFKSALSVRHFFSALIPALLVGLIIYWWVYTRLAFSPVPWPDGSAFYLPGFDWFLGSLKYRMHAQSAFIPSYDEANFNTMPFLPALFGISELLGLSKLLGGPVQMTRVLSLVPLFLAAYFLFQILKPKGVWISSLISLCALMDPVLRWGTLVVRPETWIGLIWIWIIYVLKRHKPESKTSSWGIPILLALAAYIHFEAIYLIPGLFTWGIITYFNRPKKLISILIIYTFRTALFLVPWLIYVARHWGLFLLQMDTQFHRLEQINIYTQSLYSFFHSLFIALGSAEHLPKFFNIYKFLFWGSIFALSFRIIKILTQKKATNDSVLFLSCGAVFVSFLTLWTRKPEVWFITLIHFGFWTWLVVHFAEVQSTFIKTRFALGFFGIWLSLSVSTQAVQHSKTDSQYSRVQYNEWISCIHRTIARFAGAIGKREDIKIWQPHVPDALVELQHREPKWDLTRALDFQKNIQTAWEYTFKVNAIILSRHFKAPSESEAFSYKGNPRQSDLDLMKNGVEVPFGPWVLERFPKEHTEPNSISVCHYPPFWAGIVLLNNH